MHTGFRSSFKPNLGDPHAATSMSFHPISSPSRASHLNDNEALEVGFCYDFPDTNTHHMIWNISTFYIYICIYYIFIYIYICVYIYMIVYNIIIYIYTVYIHYIPLGSAGPKFWSKHRPASGTQAWPAQALARLQLLRQGAAPSTQRRAPCRRLHAAGANESTAQHKNELQGSARLDRWMKLEPENQSWRQFWTALHCRNTVNFQKMLLYPHSPT